MAWAPDTQEVDGCWLWRGWTTADGYGMRRVDGVPTYVHRASYEAYIGPIPDGLHIDHLCRVRNCYNTAHLEAVTQAENNRRAAAARDLCPKGHPLDGRRWNAQRGKVVRRCLTCHRDRERARRVAA